MMLRIGMVGAGWVAEQHLTGLHGIKEARVTAIFDPNRDKAETLAARCGAQVYDSPTRVIQNVDVVYALAPQDVRVGCVLEAARHKRHLFIEKPFALTLSEADRQIEAIQAAGVKAQIGFVMRRFAHFELLHDTFHSGELGELVTVWTRRMWFRTFPPDYYQASLARSGGLTTELNVHDFDWLRTIGGEVQSVYGCTARTRPDRDVEENSWSLLNFKRGFGSVGTSWLSALSDTSAGIIGTKGTILLDNTRVTKKLIDAEAEQTFAFEGDLQAEAYVKQEREFIDCILRDRQPSASVQDGRAATAIAMAVLESARTNTVVAVI
jgi:UDP-N-acetylglucosamine 3-dehydrogenase